MPYIIWRAFRCVMKIKTRCEPTNKVFWYFPKGNDAEVISLSEAFSSCSIDAALLRSYIDCRVYDVRRTTASPVSVSHGMYQLLL